MTIDIFVKSYKPDFWLLQLSLETIKRNVTGYNNIILLIPEKDANNFDTRNMPDRTLIHYVKDEGVGWLRQQVFKMKAYEYCFAEYIMFSDSDVIFEHPINLQDYIVDGKPEVLYTSWDKVGDAICWKEPTEKFLKCPVEWETMRRNNQIYHRSTLVNISQYQPSIEQLIMSSNSFSEFNAMSSYAMKYENDKYNFVNTVDWVYVQPLGVQLWSHSSKADGVSETHLREWIRTLETILKAFNLPIPNKT